MKKFKIKKGNGFIHFGKPRHPFLEATMKEFANNYNAVGWASNGPELIKKMIKKFCNLKEDFPFFFRKLILDNNKERNQLDIERCNITIFPENYFYPINWASAGILFKKNKTDQLKSFIKETYSLHHYGKVSSFNKIDLYGNSILYSEARKKCPVTYKQMIAENILFF